MPEWAIVAKCDLCGSREKVKFFKQSGIFICDKCHKKLLNKGIKH